MVACDWPEHRCALSFALNEPPDLTAVRLQACAAAHCIIGRTSSVRAADTRSDENIMSYDRTLVPTAWSAPAGG
eukprot:3110057-Prymnesium_polylepis.1